METKGRVWGLAEYLLAWLLLIGTMCAGAAMAQGVATTTVTETVYRADGTTASGTVLVSWPAFSTASGASIPAGSTSATIGAGGALSVPLVPNAGSTPMGSYYTVVYHLDDGSTTHEYWVVPVSASPVTVGAIRSSVLPASVAMQTVSKAYVDTAITAAQLGHPLDESTPYVLKTGDTMTGPLVLPGDPTTPNQAADMNYVNTQIASLAGGIGQKVSMLPTASQTVAQPVGTTLSVSNLNSVESASRFTTGGETNGIANATATTDCANGCTVVVEPTYPATEAAKPTTWAMGTHVEDLREGVRDDSFLDPLNTLAPNPNGAEQIDLFSTRSAAAQKALVGNLPSVAGLVINASGLTGGNNAYPVHVQGAVPYFKSSYFGEYITGNYYTTGQHIGLGQLQNCYGVGDCLIGSQFIYSSGGFRDDADEGAHPHDVQILEDERVLEGTCQSGCTPGSTQVQLSVTANPGTEGEGRYLIDLNPAHVITTGTITGGTGPTSGRQPSVSFSGSSFPVSTFLETAQTITSQANVMQPGTVTVPIVTSGVPTGFQTSTAALPASSGVACVTDVADADSRALNYEMANYSVVDGSDLSLTLNRPHGAGATIAVGGLCGYGLEETVDTTAGIRQVFPVVGSTSATSLLYAGGITSVIGRGNTTSAYLNLNASIAGIARSGNVVTVTTAANLPVNPNGLTLAVTGVADSSFNGFFTVTTTGPNTLTYSQSGANSTSSGGSLVYLNGSFALYPMAEVVGVYNTATKAVDGLMTLAANTVPWATNDPVEHPHYFQERVGPESHFFQQFAARPESVIAGGITYEGNNGPGLAGWQIDNATDPTLYLGNGGTRTAPDVAMQTLGVWNTSMSMTAGVSNVLAVHCNLHGCGRWDSAYNLFALDSATGVDDVTYAPAMSALTLNLAGTQYGFTPQGFTAGTINATTVNATNFTGTIAPASVPVFGASGASHSVGGVPDPGAAAGTSRYLREDGTWATVVGGVSAVNGQTGSVTVDAAGAAAAVQTNLNATNTTVAAHTAALAALAPVATSGNAKDVSGIGGLPQRANLLGEYLLNEGSGTVAHDTSGLGNHGTISGPTWEGTTDLSFTTTGEYIQMPTSINQANTFQFAIYDPPFGAGSGAQPPGYGQTLNFAANPSLLCGTDTGHTCLIGSSFVSGPKSQRFFAYNTSHTEAKETLSAGWHVVTFVNGQSGQPDHWYFDGAEVNGYTTQGTGGILHPSTGNYQIGGSSAYTSTWWMGKVAAAWAWSTSLSAGDVQAAAASATSYVRSKGGFQSYRANPHDGGLIIGGLDSRTAGSNGLTSSSAVWLANLSLTDTSYTTLNLGMPGSMAFDDAAMFDLLYAPAIGTSASGPTITVLWGGVNDFPHGLTARQIANSLKSMTMKAKALGSRVIVATEISSNNGGDAYKDGLNPIIRGEALSWGADNIADLATIAQLGADGAYASTTYFADGLHPNNTGEAYLDTVFSDAINELIGSNETTNRHKTTTASYSEVAGDRFLDLTGTAAQTVTLPSCVGYSLTRQVVNLGSVAATVAPVSGQTLTGATSIAVGARAVFSPVPGALASGGCVWERIQ